MTTAHEIDTRNFWFRVWRGDEGGREGWGRREKGEWGEVERGE